MFPLPQKMPEIEEWEHRGDAQVHTVYTGLSETCQEPHKDSKYACL